MAATAFQPIGCAPRFGVIVPCRNEAAVVERRIRNLARLDWPVSDRPHRVLVVDDGSNDGTAERARAAIAALPERDGIAFEVLDNPGPHGKAQAMRLAIDALDDVDLVLLTDADVVFREATPLALAEAFAADPQLGMASGAQEFVERLPDDGSPDRPDPAGEPYDHLTARIRALESWLGRLFSVHGQCLAWRAELEIRPLPGFAADDLDLRQQVRASGAAIRLVPGARFLEEKIADPEERETQAIRRAVAYFQFVRRTPHGPGRGFVDRLHWSCYRRLPASFPYLLPGLLVVPTVLLLPTPWRERGALEVLAFGAWLVAIAWLAHRTRRINRWIRIASARERRRSQTDSWETARA